jgi:DNA polymerase-4
MENIRKIVHIDMDAFFASVEERDFPELKGRPVAVGRPVERGVVATANYEARKYGVHSAMSSKMALQRCPQLIFQPPRFEVYKAVSRQVHEIFAEYTDIIEPLSIDEAYLDVTDNKKGMPSATIVAREIKRRIRETTLLTASAGVSYNKFLAKIASDYDKPDGLFVIEPKDAVAFVATLPVGKFYGIGPVTEKHLVGMGIRTGADLQRLTLAEMNNIFGKNGQFFYDIVRGIDNREVVVDRERKSYSSECTFEKDLNSNFAVVTELYRLEQRVWEDVSRAGKYGKTVTLKMRFADFSTITRSYTSEGYVCSFAELHAIVKSLLSKVDCSGRGVRLLGVGVSNLTDVESECMRQLSLKFK